MSLFQLEVYMLKDTYLINCKLKCLVWCYFKYFKTKGGEK